MNILKKLDQRFSIQDHGLIPDCLKGTRGSMTTGTNVLTRGDPDPLFTQDMVANKIAVYGAGPTCYANTGLTLAAGDILLTTVATVAVDGLSLTTADNATATATETQWASGTDNTPMFVDAMQRLRVQGGGTLNWDQPGDYFFGSAGWTGPFGDHYIDRVDFDNCHINQGLHTLAVFGFPMGFLEINQTPFNKWTLVEAGPPIADITGPVAKGDFIIPVNAAQLVDVDGNPLFKRGDFVLIYTGYIGTFYQGFNLPDAQICQMVFADVGAGTIILSEPVLKPFAQETYPAWTGGVTTSPVTTPPTGPAPFAVMNVTDIMIRNFRYTNLNADSFFFTDLFTGGQCHGMYFDGARLKIRGTWHSMNYVHTGRTNDVYAFLDNLGSPRLPFDYAFTFAVGTSYVTFENSQIVSLGTTFLHIHEGNANCVASNVSIGAFNGNPNSFGIQPVSIRGRSHGFKMVNCHFTGFDGFAKVYIEDSCTDGGLILNCTIGDSPTNTYPLDIECFGSGWRIDCPNIEPARIYQKSTNTGAFLNRHDDLLARAIEATTGLTAAHGGMGRAGNILTSSDNLKSGATAWTNNTGVTVTAGSTDFPDLDGANKMTKVVLGTIGATEIGYDVPTPDPGVVTRGGGSTATNAGRTFTLSLLVMALTETQMDIQIASFNGTIVDPDNNFISRFPASPGVPRRIDMEVTFGAGASDTSILINLCHGLNHTGGGSTMYVYGVTFQENNSPIKGMLSYTQSIGQPIPYILVMRHRPGNLQIGAIADDGVTPVQMIGPLRVTDLSTLDTLKVNGLNFDIFSLLTVGCHSTDGGATFIADATTALIVQFLGSQFIVYQNSGLSVGSPFTPTVRFLVSNSSMVIDANPVTFTSSGYTGSRPLKLNASKELITATIDLAAVADVGTTITGIINGGTGGNTAIAAANNLSVYTKAEIDAIILNVYAAIALKATAGSPTGVTSGHTHGQT